MTKSDGSEITAEYILRHWAAAEFGIEAARISRVELRDQDAFDYSELTPGEPHQVEVTVWGWRQNGKPRGKRLGMRLYEDSSALIVQVATFAAKLIRDAPNAGEISPAPTSEESH